MSTDTARARELIIDLRQELAELKQALAAALDDVAAEKRTAGRAFAANARLAAEAKAERDALKLGRARLEATLYNLASLGPLLAGKLTTQEGLGYFDAINATANVLGLGSDGTARLVDARAAGKEIDPRQIDIEEALRR